VAGCGPKKRHAVERGFRFDTVPSKPHSDLLARRRHRGPGRGPQRTAPAYQRALSSGLHERECRVRLRLPLPKAPTMNLISLRTVWIAATVAITSAAADKACARTSFDGSWTVQIMTQRGACDPSSSFGVEVRGNSITGSGGIPVRGTVSGNGTVTVSVASGSQSASGSGRLSASSGGGTAIRSPSSLIPIRMPWSSACLRAQMLAGRQNMVP